MTADGSSDDGKQNDTADSLEPQRAAALDASNQQLSAPSDDTLIAAERAAAVRENVHYSKLLEKQIKAQRTNLIIAAAFALLVQVVGIVLTLYLVKTGNQLATAWEYIKLGPATVGGLALPIPLKMYLSYRIRAPIYEGYKELFDEAAARGARVGDRVIDDTRDALKSLHKLD